KKGTKIKAIHRNKGLGEMSPEAWKYVLQRDNFTRIEVVDKKRAKEMLTVCFGRDANLRKDLLIDDASSGKNSSESVSVVSTTKKKAPAAKKAPVAKKKVTKKKVAKKAK